MVLTAHFLPKDVFRWLQKLDLSFAVRDPKHDFNNGFLIGEIISRYFPKDINSRMLITGVSKKSKEANWAVIRKVIVKRQIPITQEQVEQMISGVSTPAIDIVLSLYSYFNGKPVPRIGSRSMLDKEPLGQISPRDTSYAASPEGDLKSNSNSRSGTPIKPLFEQQNSSVIQNDRGFSINNMNDSRSLPLTAFPGTDGRNGDYIDPTSPELIEKTLKMMEQQKLDSENFVGGPDQESITNVQLQFGNDVEITAPKENIEIYGQDQGQQPNIFGRDKSLGDTSVIGGLGGGSMNLGEMSTRSNTSYGSAMSARTMEKDLSSTTGALISAKSSPKRIGVSEILSEVMELVLSKSTQGKFLLKSAASSKGLIPTVIDIISVDYKEGDPFEMAVLNDAVLNEIMLQLSPRISLISELIISNLSEYKILLDVFFPLLTRIYSSRLVERNTAVWDTVYPIIVIDAEPNEAFSNILRFLLSIGQKVVNTGFVTENGARLFEMFFVQKLRDIDENPKGRSYELGVLLFLILSLVLPKALDTRIGQKLTNEMVRELSKGLLFIFNGFKRAFTKNKFLTLHCTSAILNTLFHFHGNNRKTLSRLFDRRVFESLSIAAEQFITSFNDKEKTSAYTLLYSMNQLSSVGLKAGYKYSLLALKWCEDKGKDNRIEFDMSKWEQLVLIIGFFIQVIKWNDEVTSSAMKRSKQNEEYRDESEGYYYDSEEAESEELQAKELLSITRTSKDVIEKLVEFSKDLGIMIHVALILKLSVLMQSTTERSFVSGLIFRILVLLDRKDVDSVLNFLLEGQCGYRLVLEPETFKYLEIPKSLRSFVASIYSTPSELDSSIGPVSPCLMLSAITDTICASRLVRLEREHIYIIRQLVVHARREEEEKEEEEERGNTSRSSDLERQSDSENEDNNRDKEQRPSRTGSSSDRTGELLESNAALADSTHNTKHSVVFASFMRLFEFLFVGTIDEETGEAVKELILLMLRGESAESLQAVMEKMEDYRPTAAAIAMKMNMNKLLKLV